MFQKEVIHTFNPISAGGGGFFRSPSNFAALGDPLKVKYGKRYLPPPLGVGERGIGK